MGVYLGHFVTEGYKHRDLILRVEHLESEKENMVTSPERLGSKNDCPGEDQQQFDRQTIKYGYKFHGIRNKE